jgi:hypothetical protein
MYAVLPYMSIWPKVHGGKFSGGWWQILNHGGASVLAVSWQVPGSPSVGRCRIRFRESRMNLSASPGSGSVIAASAMGTTPIAEDPNALLLLNRRTAPQHFT